ncbi:cytochrome C [Thalassospira profundimaris]|mgnify:FL=1|uniref:Cytochrome C n=2 Tax=Thalassospira TaxID=168934 RepID=A0A367WJ59_9PROT|nr:MULTISPECIES: cytochrome c [Thalassospira]RCK40550.1 cytochrome C [Thalassospira profundimaris]|tara:strand:+ start:14103 stop:14588 length:486 start_codon:yes stop_codon:yes gene_type:complete
MIAVSPRSLVTGLMAGVGMALLSGVADAGSTPENLTFLEKPITPEQIALGNDVYAEFCASCHGANLEGQKNWKRRLDTGRMPAPPHDASGHTWRHSDQELFAITKFGVGAVVPGYESDMPAFEDVLSDEEIIAVLGYIKSVWSDEERAFQHNLNPKDGRAK